MNDVIHQESLWHETIEDALRSVVDALGGFKKVGARLWPSMLGDEAGRKLAKCLNRDRPEKLSYDEMLLVLKFGREAGIHTGIAFIAQFTGYEPPRPSDPATEKEKLQREVVNAVQVLDRVTRRLEQLGEPIPRLRPAG
jgi:hypothetical protein